MKMASVVSLDLYVPPRSLRERALQSNQTCALMLGQSTSGLKWKS